MRIILCLAWYDEPADLLTNLVTTTARTGATHLIALDGAYAAYPAGEPRSPPNQARALRRACRTHNLRCHIHTPPELWAGNEIQKRTRLFALAHKHAQPHKDWFWVVDADEHVTNPGPYPGYLADRLTNTNCNVATLNLLHEAADGTVFNQQYLRMLFRAQPEPIIVEDYHAKYRAGTKYLWHPTRPAKQTDAEPINDITVQHSSTRRPDQRLRNRQDYYQTVADHGLEQLI